jgi:protein O-GlcNAc transferase
MRVSQSRSFLRSLPFDMKQSRLREGGVVDWFREIGDWVLGCVEWFSNWKADPDTRTKLQYIAAIFGIVAASSTIIAAVYRFIKWLRQRTPDESKARALAEQLAKEARERGRFEGMQEVGLALSQKDGQIQALTRTIEELRQGAAQGTPGMERALAMLREGEFEAAEALFAAIGEAKAAEGAAANKEAAHAFRNLGNIAFLHDTDKAMRAYVKATELDPDDPDGWNQLGLLQRRAGELDASVRSFEHVLALGNRLEDRGWVAAATGNLGLIYRRRGDLEQAEAMHRKSLALNEALDRKEGMATDYGNLGLIYQTRGDLDQAEAMHRKSLAIEEALGRNEGMANQYGNLGLIYQKRGDLDQAEAMHRKSLAINEALDRKEGMAADYGNLGLIYRTRGDLDQAEAMHRKSLAIDEALGLKEGMANQYGNLGIIYGTRGDLDQAETMFRKSLPIGEALGRKEGMAATYGNLGMLYEQRGDIAQACTHWRKARDLYAQIGIPPQVEKFEFLLRAANCPTP